MQPQKNIASILTQKTWTNPEIRNSKPEDLCDSEDKSIKGWGINESTFINQIPDKYKNRTLNNLPDIHPGLIEYGKRWGKKPESLFIHGRYGNGKTSYSFALLREMFKYWNYWPRYFTSVDIDAKLLACVTGEGGEEHWLQFYSEQDILFIDDFGGENHQGRTQRQYGKIIDKRYSENKITMITSNLNIAQIGSSLGGRIASRFQEWMTLEFTGPDLRKKKTVEI